MAASLDELLRGLDDDEDKETVRWLLQQTNDTLSVDGAVQSIHPQAQQQDPNELLPDMMVTNLPSDDLELWTHTLDDSSPMPVPSPLPEPLAIQPLPLALSPASPDFADTIAALSTRDGVGSSPASAMGLGLRAGSNSCSSSPHHRLQIPTTPAASASSAPSSPCRSSASTTGGSTASPSSCPASPGGGTHRPTKSPMVNFSRKRQKEELVHLRSKVKDLQSQLARLKRQRNMTCTICTCTSSSCPAISATPCVVHSMATPASAGAGAGVGASTSSMVEAQRTPSDEENQRAGNPPAAFFPSVWQRIARKQRAEVHKSQQENKRLKQLLEGQLLVAKSLEKVLCQTPTAGFEANQYTATTRSLVAPTVHAPQQQFDQMSKDIDALSLQLDKVFAANGLDAVRTLTHDVRVHCDPKQNNLLFTEMLDCMIVPFEIDDLSDALWKSLKRFDELGRQLMVDEHQIMMWFPLDIQIEGRPLRVQMQTAAKRYQLNNKSVIVWKSVADSDGQLPGGSGDGNNQMTHDNQPAIKQLRVRIIEEGWCTMERIELESLETATLTKACLQSKPQWAHDHDLSVQPMSRTKTDLKRRRHQVGLLTDLVVGCYHQHVRILQQMAENVLMNKAVTHSSGSSEGRSDPCAFGEFAM